MTSCQQHKAYKACKWQAGLGRGLLGGSFHLDPASSKAFVPLDGECRDDLASEMLEVLVWDPSNLAYLSGELPVAVNACHGPATPVIPEYLDAMHELSVHKSPLHLLRPFGAIQGCSPTVHIDCVPKSMCGA